MSQLDTGKTIQGVAAAATSVTYTITGAEINTSTGAVSIKQLAQGQLPNAAGVLYTVPATTSAIVKRTVFANTTGASVAITLYIGGTAATNQILSVPVPANGEVVVVDDGYHVYDSLGNLLTSSTIAAGSVANSMLANMAQQTVKGRAVGAGTGVPVDLTSAQLAAISDVATTAAQGAMSAADKLFQAAERNTVVLALNNPYANLAFDGSTDDAANWNTLLTNIPDNSTLRLPPGTTIISGAISIPSGKHISMQGSGQYKTIIQSTSQTADFITVNDWYNTFEGIGFISTQTTTTAAQAVTSSTVITVASLSTALTAASGSVYIGTTSGWQLLTYSARTATTITLSSTGAGTTTIGGNVIFKTAGYAINSGAMVSNFIRNCSFNGMFNGWNNQATICGIDSSNFSNTINFGCDFNGAAVNGFIAKCTADSSYRSVAHVNVRLCGSLLIDNCDLIRAQNNLLINPTSSGAFSIYSVNSFFDTAGGSSVKVSGTSDVQRLKFTNCWMSGSVNGIEFAGAAGANSTTGVDIVNCDIYSNSANGILATTVRDFSVSGCRIANNTTAGINVSAAAGAITTFNIQNNTIGPTGIGAPNTNPNGQGILINAGAYNSYVITGNTVQGNTSNLNIVDNGTVATTDLKQISDNTGHLLQGAIATLAGTVAIPVTTETLILSGRVPANAVAVGQVFKWRAVFIGTGANITTWRARTGAVGTVAGDTVVADIVVTTVANIANGRSTYEGHLTVRSLGAPGSCEAEGFAISNSAANAASVSQTTAAAAATTAITTTAAWFIDISIVTNATGTAVGAYIEAI